MAVYRDIVELYPNIPDVSTFYSIICNPYVYNAQVRMESIKSDVRKMVGYKSRASEVEAYFKAIEKGQDMNNDIELNWRNFYEKQ